MLFVRYKFRHIEHNNTTLCTHFSNLSLVRVSHSLMTQQNSALSNFHSTTGSGSPSVVWNPHFILVHLVKLNCSTITYCQQKVRSETARPYILTLYPGVFLSKIGKHLSSQRNFCESFSRYPANLRPATLLCSVV